MRQTKIKQQVELIDGNQLIGKIVDDNDPFVSTCTKLIDELPDSRDLDRVMAIKKLIDEGTYDFDANLDSVVDAIITESTDPNPVAYPLFDR